MMSSKLIFVSTYDQIWRKPVFMQTFTYRIAGIYYEDFNFANFNAIAKFKTSTYFYSYCFAHIHLFCTWSRLCDIRQDICVMSVSFIIFQTSRKRSASQATGLLTKELPSSVISVANKDVTCRIFKEREFI